MNKNLVPKIKLTINQAINLALQTNKSILASRYDTSRNEFSLVTAKSEFQLKIIPAASASIGGGESQSGNNMNFGFAVQKKFEIGSTVSFSPNLNKTSGEYTSGLGISVQQPVLRGLGRDINLDGIKSAEYSIQSAYRSLYQTKVNIVIETVSVFYEALKQRETMQLYKAMGKRLAGHAEVAKAKEKIGLATPMDTYRAEIRLKDTEDSLTRASEAYQDALDTLKTILSLPLTTEIELQNPASPSLLAIQPADAIATALEHRIEIEQTQAEIQEAERRAAILRQKILPEINLVFDYKRFDSADKFTHSTGFAESLWGVRLETTTDISRTAEKAAYEQGALDLQAVRLNFEEKKDEIRRQVRRQLLALQESEKRIIIRTEQIKQAEGKLSLAEVKFAHGMADNFDVIEAETELQEARLNLLAAELDYSVGTYNFRAVTGRLVERD
ncbi:MAG: TolC family protein [Nitrospirota bacterium]